MQSQDEIIYQSSSALRQPRRLLLNMRLDLRASAGLSRQLFRRAIQGRYRESVLGMMWAFVPGIFMAIALTIASRAKLVNIGETDIPYPLYVILGTIIWQVFTDALNAPVQAVADARSILTKMSFPREALFLAKIGELAFELTIKVAIAAALFIFFGVVPGPYAWLAPLALIPLTCLGLTIGFLLIPFSVLFQDVVKGVTIATTYWFFLTPLVYPVPGPGLLRTLISVNPVTPLALTVRDVLIGEKFTYLDAFMWMSPLVIFTMIAAWFIAYLSMPFLIERMSA